MEDSRNQMKLVINFEKKDINSLCLIFLFFSFGLFYFCSFYLVHDSYESDLE